MRIFWFCSSLCLVIAGLALVVPADAVDQSPASSAVLAADPDGDSWVVEYPGDPADDLRGGECEPAGSFISLWTFGSRFRGNMFHFEDPGELIEFSMEFCINSEMALWFSVFEYDKASGTFCRVTIDPESDNGDVVVVTGADEECAFYSTGTLVEPVQLSAGVDYVLGVAWGEPPLTYGRDVTSNPRNFSHGQILGSVSTEIPDGPPVDPEELCIEWAPSTSGVWSMELCLAEDPGACCLPDGSCRDDLKKFQCQDPPHEGEFAAPRVWCDDVADDQDEQACPMIPGACCIGGGCQDRNRYACDELGGEWAGEWTVCSGDPDPCVPNGACCVGCACQDELTEADCLGEGGIYRGDGTDCATLPSPCTAGACCTGTECDVDSYQTCVGAGGSFAGFGTTCESNPCHPTGACCADECMDSMSATQCAGEGGVYRGDWTACTTLSPGCGLGACCIADAGCIDGLSEASCEQVLGGTFRGEGTACDSLEVSCPGRCCTVIGCLDHDVSPEKCTAAEGVFLGYDVSCSDVADCDDEVWEGELCCLDSGTCVMVAEGVCDGLPGGELNPDCSEETCVAPLVGACCLADEICAELTSDACDQAAGIYQGDPSQCETGLCIAPLGACCIDGECAEMSCSECVNDGGTYQDGGTTCDPDPCEAISIIGSEPPDGAIDAGQPSDVTECSTVYGWASIDITFSGDASGVGVSDFAVTLDPPGTAPSILAVTHPSSDTVTLELNGSIPPGHWTIFTHVASGTNARIGFLPADVNGDGTSGPVDILDLIDFLNEVGESLELWQTDIDRSGETNPADILGEIDLLNGAGCFDPWNGESLP